MVVDTFRAFTTAAHLLAAGVAYLFLAADLDEARALARREDALLCGEDGGRKPADFDLGNSPTEVEAAASRLVGSRVVQRSTSGTRSVLAALDAGASPVWAASLVVARATARHLTGLERVTIVAAGDGGVDPAPEDDLTGDRIVAALTGAPPPDAGVLRDAETARRLLAVPWAHPGDLERCLEVDRFDFAMEVVDEGGVARLRAVYAGRADHEGAAP